MYTMIIIEVLASDWGRGQFVMQLPDYFHNFHTDNYDLYLAGESFVGVKLSIKDMFIVQFWEIFNIKIDNINYSFFLSRFHCYAVILVGSSVYGWEWVFLQEQKYFISSQPCAEHFSEKHGNNKEHKKYYTSQS